MIHIRRRDLDLVGRRILGAAAPVRDAGALDSAIGRPRNVSAMGETNVFVVASYYADGIVRSHPFCDGNKRMAWASTAMFLAINGLSLQLMGAARIVEMMVDLAEGSTTREYFAGFIDAGSTPRGEGL